MPPHRLLDDVANTGIELIRASGRGSRIAARPGAPAERRYAHLRVPGRFFLVTTDRFGSLQPDVRSITGSPKGVPIHTTLRIDGANCSACFNDVLESLRQAAGVRQVNGSISESFIEIDHADDVGLDHLADIARPHAHGIEMYANEIRMVPLEPTPCGHHHRSEERPPTT